MRRFERWTVSGLALLVGLAAPVAAQAPVLEHEGAAALGLALRRLGATQRVLMVGAHPDDENTALIAELALGRGADVAYLSLTRGEGGQNLIGPELEAGLGLIRTEELLAARRLDGARQFFTRAIDYGYSKSADEAFRHWPRDSLLADVVAVVRRFRPDVIVPVFSGTPRDGHGQHQASGIMAREAFEAAADARRFPGQIAAGLEPHRAHAAWQALYRPGDDTPLYLTTGEYDPLLGRSHYQIAMASRSRHRSQDMGQAQPPGPQRTALDPIAGTIPDAPLSLFAGVDSTLSLRATRLPGADALLLDALREYESRVAAVRAAYNPLRPDAIVSELAAALAVLDRARTHVPPQQERFLFHLDTERDDVAHALRLAAGIVVDATVDDAIVVPGQTVDVTVRVWNGGAREVDVAALGLVLPAGWMARPVGATPTMAPAGELTTQRFQVTLPVHAAPSESYFLERPNEGDMYEWPASVELRGQPFEPPALRARAALRVAGQPVETVTEATQIEVDKALGEQRVPVRVVPAVGVTVQPSVAVVPLRDAEVDGPAAPVARDVLVTLTNEAPEGVAGTIRLDAPPGWHVEPAAQPASLTRPGERATFRFRVTPPDALPAGEHAVQAVFATDGMLYERGYARIDYPHTQPRLLFQPARTVFSAFPVAVAEGLRIGYIEGAGDNGADVLRQLGVSVELLDGATLASGDLSGYDAIVAGIRVYEVRPDVAAANARLLEYVRNGGTFIVQYNKYELIDGEFAPYPLTMARPAGRVTDEASPVELLVPEHPILARPNRITRSDFEGWVQERGLYFIESWGPEYTPLLALTDPGEAAERGSLLVAEHGEGHYVYVALSFFRQWPAGVPGAYRLMANLVSLGASGRR